MKTTLLALATLFSATQAPAQSMLTRFLPCEERVDEMKKLFAEAKPLPELFADKIDARTEVVAFAERHDDYPGKLHLIDFMAMVKKAQPALDCLFLELPNEFQPLVDAHLDYRLGQQEVVERIFDAQNKVDRSDLMAPRTGYGRVLDSWMMLSRKAASLGMSVHLIDTTAAEFRRMYDAGIDNTAPRNHVMADAIDRLIKSGRCHAGMLSTGAEHLSLFESSEAKDERLQSLLKAAGHPTVSAWYESDTEAIFSPFYFSRYEPDWNAADEGEAELAIENECEAKASKFYPAQAVGVPASAGSLPIFRIEADRAEGYEIRSRLDQFDLWIWAKP